MANPTAEQVYQMMKDTYTQEDIPASMKIAYEVAPSLLVDHGVSSKQSIKNEKNPFDDKTSVLIFLAASLALKNNDCIKAFVKRSEVLDISNEELISLIKIVKHAAASGILGSSENILDFIANRK